MPLRRASPFCDSHGWGGVAPLPFEYPGVASRSRLSIAPNDSLATGHDPRETERQGSQPRLQLLARVGKRGRAAVALRPAVALGRPLLPIVLAEQGHVVAA